MKNLMFLALFFLSLAPAFSQDLAVKDIPQPVLSAFQSKYQGVAAAEWEKKGANSEVEFKAGTLEHKILYNKTGSQLFHKEDIAASDLPADVNAALASKYPNFSALEAEKISEKGKVTYSVDIKTASGEKREVHLNGNGKIALDRLD